MAFEGSVVLPSLTLLMIFSNLFLINENWVGAETDKEKKSIIRSNCDKTEYPDVCNSALESDPRSTTANTTAKLARLAMEVAVDMANETLSYIDRLLGEASECNHEADLKDCRDAYDLSVFTITNWGLESFDQHDYGAAARCLGYADGGAADCNDTGIQKLYHRNTMVFKFAIDASIIVESLYK